MIIKHSWCHLSLITFAFTLSLLQFSRASLTPFNHATYRRQKSDKIVQKNNYVTRFTLGWNIHAHPYLLICPLFLTFVT